MLKINKALLLLLLVPGFLMAQFTGRTWEERRDAYIADQGRRWEQFFPAAMKQGIYAWLERPDEGNNRQLIDEELTYITGNTGRNGEPDCKTMGGNFWWPWKNCWWSGDQPGQIHVSRIYYQYYQNKRVLNEDQAVRCKEKLRGIAFTQGIWCGVVNYNIRYITTAYLYVSRVENVGEVEFPYPSDDKYQCPQPFSYNGRSYKSGGKYDSKQLYYDWLNYKIDGWLREGCVEDLSNDYYYAQLHSTALLYDFCPDATLKNKAKMYLDWLIFNYSVSFSAYHPSGGHGRSYLNHHNRGEQFTPWSTFFSMDRNAINILDREGNNIDMLVSDYRHPQLLTQIFESINGASRVQDDSYYRIIRGSIPAFKKPWWFGDDIRSAYRYDYITPNYNIGGTGIGTGWEVNILSEGVPFKLFISSCDPNEIYCGAENTDEARELLFLGTKGYQYRNAIFVDGGGYLYQLLETNSWDEQSESNGWQFFREGNVALAVQLSSTCALELCTIGVDYNSFSDFKQAINSNARLTASSYTTSKGKTISRGFVDLGDEKSSLPFDRLEVWEGNVGQNNEKKLVDWNNDIMTVERGTDKIIYNFNTWKLNDTTVPQDVPPRAPANVRVNIKSN